MYGIFTYIYHKFKPNVDRYSTQGAVLGMLYNIYIYNVKSKVKPTFGEKIKTPPGD